MRNMLYSSRRWFALVPIIMLGFSPSVLAQMRPTHRPDVPDFDNRVPSASTAAQLAEREKGKSHLAARLPSATVDLDPLLKTPKFIHSSDGFLTGPQGQGRAVSALTAQALPANDPHLPIKAFLNEHSALFGHGAEVLDSAQVKRDYVDAHNSLRTVVWEQRLDGIPVFQSVLMGHLTGQGELTSLSSSFVPDAAASADAATPGRKALQASPPVSAAQAIRLAAQNLGVTLSASDVTSTGGAVGDGGYLIYKTPLPAYARLVWLPLHRSALRLGWEVLVDSPSSHERFRLVIDAQTGAAHLRQGLTAYISDATYNVYTSDSPSPFSPGLQTPGNFQPPFTNRVLVTTPALDTTASPDGWIPDGANTTTGNNVDAFVDRNFDGQPDRPRPVGNPNRVFDFPLDFTLEPTNYIDASTVQMFYWVNWYHDRLYELGFTEAAGNYQENNFGRGGLGNDSIIAYVQAGADFGIANNAFFAYAPDGVNGQIAMFVWDGPNPDRDGDLDADVILHEATHGTSGRLVGAGVGISALQTAGMGEGWSDFYALSLNSQASDDPDAAYAAGGYVTYRLAGLLQNYYFGVRHYPYCTDMTKNPFTFKDIDPNQVIPHTGVPLSPIYPFDTAEASEVHHQGEVWCNTLWEVRANLIHKYGFAGNQLMLQLVTDAMKLGPANPNFLQARDAILLADRVDNGGANILEIWLGFAKRGMGFSARSPDSSTTTGVFESFDLPGLQVDHAVISGGNGNGIIDFNECNNLQIFLVNNSGFLVSGISARLSSSTPGVIIAQPVSAYPTISDGATNADLTLFKVSTAPTFICGTPIDFTMVIKSDQVTTTTQFTLPTGVPVPPARFDNFTPAFIPDADPNGTNSLIVVSNVLSAVSKVTVALHINHTFDSDLLLQLISPDGVTNTLSAHHGSSGQNYGISCSPDSQRTTFDDAATVAISAGLPPFVGSFIPDQPLSIFAGKSGTNVNGTWTLHVTDNAAADVGTIICWSLFLTSAQCTDGGGECPGADLAIGMVAQPDPLIIGNFLTYTISVTNNGPSAAKHVTVAHLLPGGVGTPSTSSSQGSCSFAGGIVTGNLGTIPAKGRATMTVVVLPGSAGTLSSSATVTSDEFDFDTSNNSASVVTQVNPPTSDLALGLVAAPEPVVLGAALAYSVSVTNFGPSAASGILVTNVLPVSMAILSATVSQGSVTISSNVVVCNFGGLGSGGRATATINVTPTAEGSFVATSAVSANQFDPTPANNSASFTSSVGPAADLRLGLIDIPDPVVLGSNFVYIISVTNFGPSVASSVIVNQSLPVSVNVVSNFTSQGSNTISGNSLSCALGTLAVGARATIITVVASTVSGTLTSTASVASSQPDPNPADNSATITTLVSVPFVSIVPSGATLTSESFAPTNGAIDIGETVTVILRLRNTGNVNATNIVATLLTNSAVAPTSLNNTQAYGALAGSGPAVGRPFSFTATGTNGQTIAAVLRVQGGGLTTNVTFNFTLPSVITFSNTAYIAIRDNTSALPYPSTINVSGLTGLVSKATATLVNISHTFPEDVDVLLVGPSSQKTILMSGAGSPPLATSTLTFSDTAANPIPDGSGQIVSGSYRPADYTGLSLPPPAPAGTYPAAMSVFNTVNPNGTWSLFVDDHSAGDTGSIAGGWSLALTLITPVNQIADLGITVNDSPDPCFAGNNLTYTFTITNGGPNNASFVTFNDSLPNNVALISAASSQGLVLTNATTVTGNLGPLAAGATATVTVIVTPGAAAAGLLTNTASISASEIDLNPANSTVSAVTTINLPLADLALTQVFATNMVVINSNLTSTITVSNAGPGNALDVLITNHFPAAFGSLSPTVSQGSVSNLSGTTYASLGMIAPGSTATLTLNAIAVSVGTFTNIPTVSTTSSDTNSANNSAAAAVTILNLAPNIVAAGVLMISESGLQNRAIDPGETVSLSLGLQNVGSASTSAGLTATLQASGGVTPLGATQKVYGVLVPAGPARSNTFSFVANGVSGGTVTATLQLQDGAVNLGMVNFTFNFPGVSTFSNTAAITIPDHGSAVPYPSSISVSGLTGLVSKARVTLNGLSHSFPRDVNALLVGPTGANVLLMSHTGGAHAVTNLTLTFDDAASASLPQTTALTAGSAKPTSFPAAVAFHAPAPAGPYGTALATVNAKTPNGLWSLYVFDDSVGDAGSIAGGWTLELTTVNTVNPIADLQVAMSSAPASLFVGATFTNTISLTNLGPNSATGVYLTNIFPASVSVVSSFGSLGSVASSGSGVFTWNVGSLAAGSGARVTVVLAPSLGASISNVAVVAGSEADLNFVNNSAETVTTVTSPMAATLAGSVSNHQFHLTVIAEPGLPYIIQTSSNLINWVSVATNTASAGGGTIKFTNANSSKNLFYRAKRRIP